MQISGTGKVFILTSKIHFCEAGFYVEKVLVDNIS